MSTDVVTKPAKRGASMSWVYDLYRIGLVIGKSPMEDVRDQILQHVVAGFSASTGCLALADASVKQLTITSVKGLPVGILGNRIDVGSGIMGKVAQDREPMLLNGDQSHLTPARQTKRPSSAICWPLVMDNQVIGALSVNRRANEPAFNQEDVERGRIIISMISVAVQNTCLKMGSGGGAAMGTQALLAICHKLGGLTVAEALELPADGSVYALEMFANLIAARSQPLGERCLKTATHAYELALEMGEPEADSRQIQAAALIHELGRLSLSDEHITSPDDSLDPDTKQRLRDHVLVGQAMLMAVPALVPLAAMVRHHHEDFSGGGYPDGLSGGDIPKGARIIRVVSDFYGLQDGSVQEGELSADQAASVLRHQRELAYDPTMAKMFLELVGLGEDAKSEVSEWCLPVPELKPGMVVLRPVELGGNTVANKHDVLDRGSIANLAKLAAGTDLTVYVLF